MIPVEDRKKFLKLARDSIIGEFSGIKPDPELKDRYVKKQGVFVTLHKNGALRGCIGFPEPFLPLYEGVVEAAKHAAFQDPRFPQVNEEEMEDINIEISVLTVPEELNAKTDEYEKKIEIGKDGLIIRGDGSGLLLPQVAIEHKLDPREFLECVCDKAMLGRDAWKDESNTIYTFQAEIFQEKDI